MPINPSSWVRVHCILNSALLGFSRQPCIHSTEDPSFPLTSIFPSNPPRNCDGARCWVTSIRYGPENSILLAAGPCIISLPSIRDDSQETGSPVQTPNTASPAASMTIFNRTMTLSPHWATSIESGYSTCYSPLWPTELGQVGPSTGHCGALFAHGFSIWAG